MQITPFILGSGRAAQAMAESLRILEIVHPHFKVEKIQKVKRGQSLRGLAKGATNPVLCIANPHALHAQSILEADAEGFSLIVTEKPAAVNFAEVKALENVKTPVAVCHVYRQMWGVQTLKNMIQQGDFGALVSVEGRYWQSSAAQRSLGPKVAGAWKNEIALSGPSDALLDVGTHWVDAATFLLGENPSQTQIWLSYANAESAHRDTHVQLQMDFPSKTRAFASISKNIHGAANHFELNVIGSKMYAAWKFLEPDQIEIGQGAKRSFVVRGTEDRIGSGHPPFHGVGWLEGYVEILFQALSSLKSEKKNYPTLKEHLKVLEALLPSLPQTLPAT